MSHNLPLSPVAKGYLWGIGGVVVFGFTLPFTRLVVPVMDPVFVGLGRAVFAAVIALCLLLGTRSPWPGRRQWLALGIVAAGVVIGFPVLSAIAMQSVPATHGGVVLGLLPLATALASVLVNRERPPLWFWITAIAGALLVVIYAAGTQFGAVSSGDLFLVGATVSAAIGYAISGRLARSMGGWRVICWALVVALPFIVIPAWTAMPKTDVVIAPHQWLAFAYLALASQLGGFFLWNRGLALGGVARVSQVQLLQPFITLVGAMWILSEVITMRDLAFAVAVVVCVALNKRILSAGGR